MIFGQEFIDIWVTVRLPDRILQDAFSFFSFSFYLMSPNIGGPYDFSMFKLLNGFSFRCEDHFLYCKVSFFLQVFAHTPVLSKCNSEFISFELKAAIAFSFHFYYLRKDFFCIEFISCLIYLHVCDAGYS